MPCERCSIEEQSIEYWTIRVRKIDVIYRVKEERSTLRVRKNES
jgi:hypothetical protein